MSTLRLYSTAGCHLCEQAQALVREVYGQAVPEYDVIDNEQWYQRYALHIPVLLRADGQELGWPFDAQQLRQFLDL